MNLPSLFHAPRRRERVVAFSRRGGGRAVILGTATLFLLQTSGCYTTQIVPTDRATAERSEGGESQPVEITGYVTPDGELHELDGTVTLRPDGTLLFEPRRLSSRETDLQKKKQAQPFSLPREDVSSLLVKRLHKGRTTLAVVGGVVGTVVGLALIVALTKESCPFIYSFDGERWVFDGEPYGAAITHGLERSDLSELEHVRETNGEYRLLITNEVDETQHTDSLHLVVIDHPPGTVAVADQDGNLHAFAQIETLGSARSASGRDLTRWLLHDDGVAWEDDLEHLAGHQARGETRDTVEIRFTRPRGVSRAWLLTRVANTEWASHMLRRSLDWRGSAVHTFYASLDNDPLTRSALQSWHLREEVFLLSVEVGGNNSGELQGVLVGGGPFVAERRALPIDLGTVDGDEIVVRVRPPFGFWALDWFALAWDERPADAARLAPAWALNDSGQDVTDILTSDDDVTLDFPHSGDQAILNFRAPARPPGVLRTVFAATRGWYDIHLHNLEAEPDAEALVGLSNQPGWLVTRAVEEFLEYRQTGVLGGRTPPAPLHDPAQGARAATQK